jgi:flavin reductase (DIM6/NTAB) family NADH-FMN oxidoreductase RutF
MTTPPTGGNLLSLFWTPIVAVGCGGPGGRNAQISVSTFGAGVVPEQPRLLVVLYKQNYTHDLVIAKGDFSLSVLSEAQLHLISALGFETGRETSKLETIDYRLSPRGNPIFDGGAGWLECEVIEAFDFGDSTAFLSGVVENERTSDAAPLVWSRLLPTLPQDWRDQWEEKMARDIECYRALMRWR